jgi:hypothetical protein
MTTAIAIVGAAWAACMLQLWALCAVAQRADRRS